MQLSLAMTPRLAIGITLVAVLARPLFADVRPVPLGTETGGDVNGLARGWSQGRFSGYGPAGISREFGSLVGADRFVRPEGSSRILIIRDLSKGAHRLVLRDDDGRERIVLRKRVAAGLAMDADFFRTPGGKT